MVTRWSVVPTADLPKGDKTEMKYFVYFLKSLHNGDVYVGSTRDIFLRVASHNAGRVQSTKAYRPWKLLDCVECNSRSEAMRIERFYKTGQQKELLRKKYGQMAKG